MEGWGEAAPSRFYGETPDTVWRRRARARLAPDRRAGRRAWALEDLDSALYRALHGNAAARTAIGVAFHDLAGKRLGVPIYRLWGLTSGAAPASSFTIAIAASDEELIQRVREASAYPVLKVKLGTDRDEQRSIRLVAQCGAG